MKTRLVMVRSGHLAAQGDGATALIIVAAVAANRKELGEGG